MASLRFSIWKLLLNMMIYTEVFHHFFCLLYIFLCFVYHFLCFRIELKPSWTFILYLTLCGKLFSPLFSVSFNHLQRKCCFLAAPSVGRLCSLYHPTVTSVEQSTTNAWDGGSKTWFSRPLLEWLTGGINWNRWLNAESAHNRLPKLKKSDNFWGQYSSRAMSTIWKSQPGPRYLLSSQSVISFRGCS